MNSGRVLHCFTLCFLCFLATIKVFGQAVKAKEGSFGIDENQKIIVWHQKNIDSVLPKSNQAVSFEFNRIFKLDQKPKSLAYDTPLALKSENSSYRLYITKLPIVHLKTRYTVKDNIKTLGLFTYFNGEKHIKNHIGIEHRGNLSLSFPKKSYDLEFWGDTINKTSVDVKFKGLRSDDDWILDGLFNEPLRIRSSLAAKLWLEIHQPSYLESEPKAKSGFDIDYVEVFKNDEYIGVYALSEPVDRKLLALKKNEEHLIQGALFKASSYEGAPEFKKAPKFNNLFPHWGGFEMKYPLVDSRASWETISKFVNLVVNENDEEFASQIHNSIHIDNAIDYFLFVNLLRATDNLGKNYYLAKYDMDHPYFFVPWDLDGVLGIIQEGKRIPTTNDILSNGLFDRLLKLDPDGYRSKLKLRWRGLRNAEFDEQRLLNNINTIYSRMKIEKVYEREQLIWPSEHTVVENHDYLKSWLKERLAYLDEYFSQL